MKPCRMASPAYEFIFEKMDSNSTLNGDVQAVVKSLDAEISESDISKTKLTVPSKEFIVLPVPPYLRQVAQAEIHLGLGTISLLSFCTIFLAANLSYTLPLLIQVSETFNVSYESVSQIPAIIEAGCATGLIIISPLGEVVRRRQLLLFLVLASASLSIGLALTSSFVLFRVLAFFLGMSIISPQILVALARDHTHPSREAIFYPIILSGFLSGTLTGRLVGGSIAQILPWQFVYYFAFAVQYAILFFIYLFLPDIPEKIKEQRYIDVLRALGKCAVAESVVVQSELLSMILGLAVSSYSVTLTYLLVGAPYHYSTLKIGLFGLSDVAGLVLSPLSGYIIFYISPWGALLASTLGLSVFQAIDVAAGGTVLPALIVRCVGVDALRQLEHMSLSAHIHNACGSETASQTNTLLVLFFYLGQIVGTLAGTKIFVNNGPRAAAAFGLSCYIAQILIVLVKRVRNQNDTHSPNLKTEV